jgi:hypothetical protein
MKNLGETGFSNIISPFRMKEWIYGGGHFHSVKTLAKIEMNKR